MMLRNSCDNDSRQGFTLIELLVVLAVIATLAGLLLPSLAGGVRQARRSQCINNQRQLLLTWNLYHGDNNELEVANGHGPVPGPIGLNSAGREPNVAKFWVPGDDHFYYVAFTNADLLTDPQSAMFAPYLRSKAVYKCPEDHGSVKVTGIGRIPHVRSYSMNAYLGWSVDRAELNPDYRVFAKTSEMTGSSPAGLFVFQDVHPDNLCYPAFMVRMPGEDEQFYHYPSSLHNGRGVLTFADGHAETHRWLDPRTSPPANGSILAHWNESPGNADLAWIRERTSYRVDAR
jgi:prepilin-type N-terminal cleavage/methylation domain-containing protein/prepilin-type processing-associated H-X9-DG protein